MSRIMKHIRNQIILLALIGAAGYVAYEVLLDDEAKQGIKDLYGSMLRSYDTVATMVNDRIGTIMDEDVVEQNRQQVRNAWADLGF